MDICRKEQPFVIRPKRSESSVSFDNPSSPSMFDSGGAIPMETDSAALGGSDVNQGASTSAEEGHGEVIDDDTPSITPATLVSADGKSK